MSAGGSEAGRGVGVSCWHLAAARAFLGVGQAAFTAPVERVGYKSVRTFNPRCMRGIALRWMSGTRFAACRFHHEMQALPSVTLPAGGWVDLCTVGQVWHNERGQHFISVARGGGQPIMSGTEILANGNSRKFRMAPACCCHKPLKPPGPTSTTTATGT